MNPDPDDLSLESDDDNDSILDPFNLEGGGPPGGIVSDDDDLDDPEQLQSDGDLGPGGTGLGDSGSIEDRIFVGEAVPLDLMEDDPSASANPFDDLDAPASPPPSSAPTDRAPAPENNTEMGNQRTPPPGGAQLRLPGATHLRPRGPGRDRSGRRAGRSRRTGRPPP